MQVRRNNQNVRIHFWREESTKLRQQKDAMSLLHEWRERVKSTFQG